VKENEKKEQDWREKEKASIDKTSAMVVTALVVLAALLVIWWFRDSPERRVFWVLAVLPGLVAVVHFWISEQPRYMLRSHAVDAWLANLEELARKGILDRAPKPEAQKITGEREAEKEKTPEPVPSVGAEQPPPSPEAGETTTGKQASEPAPSIAPPKEEAKSKESSGEIAMDDKLDPESETLARYVGMHKGQTGIEPPRFALNLLGAVALTAVFGLTAQFSTGEKGIGVASPTPSATPTPSPTLTGSKSPTPEGNTSSTATPILVSTTQPRSTATPGPPAPSTTKLESGAATAGTASISPTSTGLGPTTTPTGVPGSQAPNGEEGRRGLVYAGYGAYLFCIQLLINRLNAGSVSGRFLVRLALQTAVALVLGYAAGELQIFLTIASSAQSLFLYFVLGLFPTWAWQTLRRKGRDLLAPDEAGCETLPLCLIDGIDDGIADRLWELGLADVQHLATADPIELTLKTSFTPNRVMDWIDQATLIAYVRRKIPAFRQYGIRGAIDFATVYGDFSNRMPIGDGFEPSAQRATRATELLKQLSTKAELDYQALLTIGRSLFEDENVHILWLLWQQKVPGF